jgi:hypothetical protein
MAALAAQEYLRERLEPRPGDPGYLCLSDLLIAIKGLGPSHARRVLDYGCGGSPYRSLFGECTYHRADLAGGSNLDFEYAADSRLPPEAADYHCTLSTQVLEHVEDPMVARGRVRNYIAIARCDVMDSGSRPSANGA